MDSSKVNNSSSMLSEEEIRIDFNQFITRFNGRLIYPQVILSVLGIIGNIFSVIIINKKSMSNTSSGVFITFMAIFDSAVLFLHAFDLFILSNIFLVHCSMIILTDFCTFCANWILVIISIERLIAVCWPFHAKRFCTVSSARYSVFWLLIIAISLFLTTSPFIYTQKPKLKGFKCILVSRYRLIIRIVKPIIFYGIPNIFLLSNLYTVYSLFQRYENLPRKESRSGSAADSYIIDPHASRKQRQLTLMLITVSLSFYLFTTPAMIAFVLEWFPVDRFEVSKAKRRFIFSQISVFILQSNNATNFLLFSFTGQRFREATAENFREWTNTLKYLYFRYIMCNKQYERQVVNQRHRSLSMK